MTEAVAEANGKPVFVLDHHPPFDTTAVSRLWGNRPRRRLAERFPQVIRISGHSHGSLRNERNIWQGKAGTRFRLVMDIETIQQNNCQWTMRQRNTRPVWSANYRMWTLPGRQKPLRYVFDFEKNPKRENFICILQKAPGDNSKSTICRSNVYNFCLYINRINKMHAVPDTACIYVFPFRHQNFHIFFHAVLTLTAKCGIIIRNWTSQFGHKRETP